MRILVFSLLVIFQTNSVVRTKKKEKGESDAENVSQVNCKKFYKDNACVNIFF